MRIEACVALLVSIALHAGIIVFVPGSAVSRTSSKPLAMSPPVISARLKNTLASRKSSRSRQSDSEWAALSSTAGHPSMVIGRVAFSADASRKAARIDNPLRFYPPEAIAQGLEGEAIVMLRIGSDGGVIDAQIARSSGHVILDQAALQAIRSTPRLFVGPREILFPVTFALH